MAFRLSYLHLTLAHFKDHSQSHAHFDSKSLRMVTHMANITIVIRWSRVWAFINIFAFDLDPFHYVAIIIVRHFDREYCERVSR